MLTAICPRILPAISSSGDTADSSTSIDAARLLLDGLRQQRLAADHDPEHQQAGEDERQRCG